MILVCTLTTHIILGQIKLLLVELIIFGLTKLIFNFLLSYNLESSQTSTFSDHLILLTQWTFPNAYSKPSRKHTNISRRIFNYKIMTQEFWEDFANSITYQLNTHKTPLNTNTTESIETTWHKIQHSIISSAIKLIPNKISRKRSYNHKYTSKSTLLHTSLKKLGHLIKQVKNNLQTTKYFKFKLTNSNY